MGVPARAAVEAPEGGRAPIWRAAAPGYQRTATFAGVARQWLALRLSALRLPLFAGGESIWCVVVGTARAQRRRENDFSFVIAGLDPAIHAEHRLAETYALLWSAASQHGPPGQARW
jgi:hypothetical protein